MKRLLRSRNDRQVAGICGGLARYLEVDPTIIRLVVVGIVLFTGCFPGVIGYFLAWAIIPEEPETSA